MQKSAYSPTGMQPGKLCLVIRLCQYVDIITSFIDFKTITDLLHSDPVELSESYTIYVLILKMSHPLHCIDLETCCIMLYLEAYIPRKIDYNTSMSANDAIAFISCLHHHDLSN